MRLAVLAFGSIGIISAAACAAPPNPAVGPVPATVQTVVAKPALAAVADPSIDGEADRLREAMRVEVKRAKPSLWSDETWIARTKTALGPRAAMIDHPQLIVVVDRAPKVQELAIVLARPDAPWQVIGGSSVSTGTTGRKLYYITPTGVFYHDGAILDYRAEGTYNENHIRGLGVKGMRVWDFGWQSAEKGWLPSRERGDIRLLMHATDPANLELRIGRMASMGCVRVPAALNRFMDIHGILDADYEREAVTDIRYRSLLRPDRTPTKLAGNTMVVLDSSEN